VKIFYDEAYVARKAAFDTTRKAADVADLVRVAGMALLAPERASWTDLRLAHDRQYLAALRTGQPRALAESDTLAWDPSTWHALAASTGGVLAACAAALEAGSAVSLSSGLHHARTDRGNGLCAINGLAIAARRFSPRLDGPVLVLDLDAHGSGGTQSIVGADAEVRIADVATHDFDATEATDLCHNERVGRGSLYLDAVERALIWSAQQRPALVIYNAGVDVHERCTVGGLDGVDTSVIARREEIVARWIQDLNVPICGVLAGGYRGAALSAAELAALHMLMIEALAALVE
jgi:acetoin utilization deacetylase AcuC-like enzyme